MSDDLEHNFNSSSELIAGFYHDEKITPPANIPELDTPLSLINIDKYEIKGLIDTGGMKKIYEVIDRDSTRHLAMAVPDSTDEDLLNQFIFEARVTALLEHPNIVPVHDIGLKDKLPCFTMKLINGDTLTQLIKKINHQHTNSQLNDLIAIFLKICDAIAYAHSKGIMHLDIKPDNIRLSNYGEVQVLDWGLAKFFNQEFRSSSTLTIDTSKLAEDSNSILGSPAFMSPEQCSSSKVTAQSDIYSLGAILYTILTLRPPFDQENDYKAIIAKTQSGELIKPRSLRLSWDIPSGLEAICLKAMALKPSDRYENVESLINDIRKWNNNFAPLALNAAPLHITKLFFKRNRTLLFSMTIFIVIIIIISWNSYQDLKISERQALGLAITAKENEQRAEVTLNELKTTEAERQKNVKELFQSQIQVQETLNKLEEMEETNITLAQIAINQLSSDAKVALNQSLLLKASQRIQRCLKIDPDNHDTVLLAGQIALLQGKISKAKYYFHKLKIHRFDNFTLAKLKAHQLEEFVNIYRTIKKDKLFKRTSILFLTCLDSFSLSNKDKLYILKEAYNSNHIEFTMNNIAIHKEFLNLLPLAQLPIKKIDSDFQLQHSGHILSNFKYLEEFKLKNTISFNISQLENIHNLQKVSFVNCRLYGDPNKLKIQQLSIIDSRCQSYDFITKINGLKTLSYTKDSLIPPHILKKLKNKGVRLIVL